NLSNGHRYRLSWDIIQSRKPPLVKLLPAARFVECNDDIRFFGLEIRWRVVERQMAVLAHADKSDMDRSLLQFVTDVLHDGSRVSRTAQEMILPDPDFIDKALMQVLTEACGVRFRNTNVLVQVEHFDASPINFRHLGQRVKKFKLRCYRGCDDASLAAHCDRIANNICSAAGG